MQTHIIKQTIAAAIKDETQTARLAGILRTLAMTRGHAPSAQDIAVGVSFISEYVQRVPALIESIAEAAKQAEIYGEVKRLLETAVQYWINPHDVIPDHLGLVGVMDDAYYSLVLIEQISQNHKQRTGHPLISTDLALANQVIRSLIGEPHASQLDLSVMAAVGAPSFQQAFTQLLRFPSTMQVRDPIWGNASVDEIVDARLGAMGYVR